MIYVHSFSEVEQQIFRLLALNTPLAQMDIQCIQNNEYVERVHNFGNHKTIIYSFQRFETYKHLDSFQQEIKQLKILLAYIKKFSFEKIILISYPGAYASSDNLFLQHKGLIEQMFVSTEIPCTILRVQGICSPPQHINNFHSLFYNRSQNEYLIPKKSGAVVYSVNIKNLADIIIKSNEETHAEHFDVFDKVSSLKNFLSYNSQNIRVTSLPSFYLYFQSYMSKYIAPTMFELFIRNGVPMYNFRTEKAFHISLHAEIFEHLKSKENHTMENDYIFSKKGQLIPVS